MVLRFTWTANDPLRDTETNQIHIGTIRGTRELRHLFHDSAVESLSFSYRNVTVLDLSACVHLLNIPTASCWHCVHLVTVKLPPCLQRIEEDAFRSCTKLQGISVPSSVVSIGDSAFEGSGLTHLDLSNTQITTVSYALCLNCRQLVSIALPLSVTDIQNFAFAATSITSLVAPSCVLIGVEVCRHCGKLREVILPKVTKIDDFAFYLCVMLKYVNMGVIQTIGYRAFFQCLALTSLHIPKTIVSCDITAFYRCYSLSAVALEGGCHVFGQKMYSALYTRRLVYVTTPRLSQDKRTYKFHRDVDALPMHLYHPLDRLLIHYLRLDALFPKQKAWMRVVLLSCRKANMPCLPREMWRLVASFLPNSDYAFSIHNDTDETPL